MCPLAAAAFALVLCLPVAAVAQAFYRESPELTARVRDGALPPLEKRLPRNPLLLSVEDEIGRYGGTWTQAMVGNGDSALIYRSIDYEHLVRWDPAWRRVIPNVAQSFQVSADAMTYTFRLRPGLRWSDGAPYTADDIRFWFEDVLLSPDMDLPEPTWLPKPAGAVRLEIDDPYTVRFVFAQPNGLFLPALASGSDVSAGTAFPRHALMRYHKRYNPEGADAEAKAEGLADWRELFMLRAGVRSGRSDPTSLLRRPVADAIDRVERAVPVPTLCAWVIDRLEPGSPPRLVAERNPYYWKIDPAGHQLPYIDRAEFLLAGSQEEFAGFLRDRRIGMQARHVVAPAIQAELQRYLDGGYRAIALQSSESNTVPIYLNLTHADPVLRALFGDRGFRIALSQAIDRRAIIDTVYGGEGEPFQVAPRRESRFFDETLALQHTTQDLEAANATLDRLGLVRGADGVRRLPDGRRLGFVVMVRLDRPHHEQALAMVGRDWQRIGVEISLERRDRAELVKIMQTNGFDAMIGSTDGGMDSIREAYAFIPVMRANSTYAPLWARWSADPAAPGAIEPPPAVLRQMDLFAALQRTPDPDEQDRLMRSILGITAEQFPTIGISSHPGYKALARRDFHNVPRSMPEAWAYPTPAPSNTAQYFIAP
ncbi:ABC transporter substrate-binding protein [Azospirillum sp. RWY-5-1]|uniref:ABC transporter substrate-binding protein n=1 Tax=Azospirillum oleiclasticum TaxID=2735135 RepID=A0ABX2T8G5_9PROT|nr:ABC transporter substrate-binding protein [Azospirillum oleiclasticum]NYZ13434.1 ABC transporter substrate-binding protein [Azospirillum oleiclasticum]NYZ20595.1 ABC transporter substrate-binding protein [Azospirillum oleiclasticum]